MADQRRDQKREETNTVKITEALIRAKSGEYDLLCVGRLILTNLGIRKMEGLEGLKNLVELNLTKNSIETIQGIANLKNLRKLVLISNRISKLENMDNMTSLEHLHLQDNAIQEVEEVTHLNTLPRLHSLYLQNSGGDLANPVCSRKGYRGFVLQYIPSLAILDGERISSAESLNASLMTNSLMGMDNSGPVQIPEYKSWALALRWEDAFIPKEKVDRSINTELFKKNIEDSRKLLQAASNLLTQRVQTVSPSGGPKKPGVQGNRPPSSSGKSSSSSSGRPSSGGSTRTSSK